MSAVEKSKIKIRDEQSCIIERLNTNKEMKYLNGPKRRKRRRRKWIKENE